ncbi:hypothetical protein [Rhodococcus sp. Q]|uniref:hypothetical protein n=1 Tax=Rhodococcus sp. Q TaxID=2502252 RepID=UPI0010F90332|nr:hypothetical protein [Rhodococcus sp. Q]
MSENNITNPAVDERDEVNIQADAEQELTQADEQEQADEPNGNREAAKYRRRLRETEAERDTLTQRVEALQRAEVDRIATAAKLKPEALWASGAELPALLTDTGTVDAELVAAAIATARTTLGIAPPTRNYVAREGSNPRPPATSGFDNMVNVVMGKTS